MPLSLLLLLVLLPSSAVAADSPIEGYCELVLSEIDDVLTLYSYLLGEHKEKIRSLAKENDGSHAFSPAVQEHLDEEFKNVRSYRENLDTLADTYRRNCPNHVAKIDGGSDG